MRLVCRRTNSACSRSFANASIMTTTETASFAADEVTQLPLMAESRVKVLLLEHFGVVSATLTPLTGYDDLNFRLDDAEFDDAERMSRFGRRFVCKFSNPLEARRPQLMGKRQVSGDGRGRTLARHRRVFLQTVKSHSWLTSPPTAFSRRRQCRQKVAPTTRSSTRALKVSGPRSCLNHDHDPTSRVGATRSPDSFCCHRQLSCISLVEPTPLRLFTFLPGLLLEKVGYDAAVYAKVGDVVAHFHTLTDGWEDAYFRQHLLPWTVESWHFLEAELSRLSDVGLVAADNIELCERVFGEFRQKVLSQREHFEHGEWGLWRRREREREREGGDVK